MQPIDVQYLGIERVICCWQIGDVLVDPGPSTSLEAVIEALGDAQPRAVLLTHIHLDHAGGTGTLVRRWPGLQVYVHERGAPHVIDPSKLVNSATRLYGEDHMARLYGDILGVPEANVHALRGGETLDLEGGIRVAYTPGHASHHVAYLHEDSGRAFVGDVAGVKIPPSNLTIAPTPPPDIDVEAWERSLDLIADWRPASLGLTHFGDAGDPGAQLDAVRQSLRDFAGLARETDADTFESAARATIARETDSAATARAYELAVPPDHLHLGLDRYWRKRAEREQAG